MSQKFILFLLTTKPPRNIQNYIELGPSPSPRWGHTLTQVGQGYWLFGGQGDGGKLVANDVWVLQDRMKLTFYST